MMESLDRKDDCGTEEAEKEEFIEVVDQTNGIHETNGVDETNVVGETNGVDETNGDEENDSGPDESSETMKGVTRKETPYVGMEFGTDDEAYQFYCSYAKSSGFGVRKSWVRRSKRTNEIICRVYACSKAGFKSMSDKRYLGRAVKRRRESREGCRAQIIIHLSQSGVWTVKSFNDCHTHTLTSPSKVEHIQRHSGIDASCKNLIDSFHSHMSPNTKSCSKMPMITQQQCRDRSSNIRCECMELVKYFLEKQNSDHGFFSEIQLDEEGQTQSLFWADGRSRMAYERFGDVVSFYVTYSTNKFGMPFALFTGVNHHKQSTSFGCALLADEMEETFIWLFRTWLKCMWGKKPLSIITDHDGAMWNAVRVVFPETQHRLCLWHIGSNALQHTSQLRFKHENFGRDYDKWIYKSETPEEFEQTWELLKKKYHVLENNWLVRMFEIRHHWVPLYFKDCFFAGMGSTQKCENINSFFNCYLSSETALIDLVRLYGRALMDRYRVEEHEDYLSLSTKPDLGSFGPMETHAGNIYTRCIFQEIQKEFKRVGHCECSKISKEGSTSTYSVLDIETNSSHAVTYSDCDEHIASCTCKNFEHYGFLCKHVLKVFGKKDLHVIPSRYILNRWTINARYGSVQNIDSGNTNNEKELTPFMFWDLHSTAIKIVELGSRSYENYQYVLPLLKDAMKRADEVNIKFNGTCHVDVGTSSVDENVKKISVEDLSTIAILEPKPLKCKGHPRKIERLKLELKLSKDTTQGKSRGCSFCQGKGHYMTTCPKAKVYTAKSQLDKSQGDE